MAYTMLRDGIKTSDNGEFDLNSLEAFVLRFMNDRLEGLRFDKKKESNYSEKSIELDGTSFKKNQIPYNMEKDIDRLCFANALERFLKSGKKEDAFDVYFCYLEMFIGDYKKTRRMIELLSEFEANGSGVLMKHRDHYSHSAYVFALGLAIYESNEIYRKIYKMQYNLQEEHEAAAHYLQYWGLSALFHDIGYPFELPFEQVCSYFEVEGDKRKNRPFVAYQGLDSFILLNEKTKEQLKKLEGRSFENTNELFSFLLAEKLGDAYGITSEEMLDVLNKKPTQPNEFNHFMDHAYFSAVVLFKKLFEEMELNVCAEYLDALTAILMHNSLYKFSIGKYKSAGNKPFKAALHPLAYMLMLCDELQCWDRIAYGRNSKNELHPMGARFDLSDNQIKASYLFDKKEVGKIDKFKDDYIEWLNDSERTKKAPALKAYSGMYIKKNGISDFQEDIERIVDLSEIKLTVDTGIVENIHIGSRNYLSDSNFINLYNFAIVLNGRWGDEGWKCAKSIGKEDCYLKDAAVMKRYADEFKELSLEYKLSNINQAKSFAKYLNEIGCFYTDKSVEFEVLEKFTTEELLKIGVLEHQRWLQEHYDMGWTYGEPKKEQRELKREHKDMIPGFEGKVVSIDAARKNYDRLDKAEQDKDTDPMECMLTMLRMFDGLRIYRL